VRLDITTTGDHGSTRFMGLLDGKRFAGNTVRNIRCARRVFELV
jgi:hypothetical protein